jgi:hypothetical protein
MKLRFAKGRNREGCQNYYRKVMTTSEPNLLQRVPHLKQQQSERPTAAAGMPRSEWLHSAPSHSIDG